MPNENRITNDDKSRISFALNIKHVRSQFQFHVARINLVGSKAPHMNRGRCPRCFLRFLEGVGQSFLKRERPAKNEVKRGRVEEAFSDIDFVFCAPLFLLPDRQKSVKVNSTGKIGKVGLTNSTKNHTHE